MCSHLRRTGVPAVADAALLAAAGGVIRQFGRDVERPLADAWGPVLAFLGNPEAVFLDQPSMWRAASSSGTQCVPSTRRVGRSC